jgi:hypothetical protein
MRLNFELSKKRLVFLSIGILALTLSLATSLRLASKKLVVVDVTRAIQMPATRLSHSKLSPEAQSKIMQEFSNMLPKVIQDYSKAHGVMVISAPILAGHNEVDITTHIATATLERMKHEA